MLYAEEYLGGKLEKLSFEITNCVRNELIEYKVLFPESIICLGGSFSIKPYNGGAVFTAALSFRFGWLVSRVAKKRAEAIRLHMKEEGENLKELLEKEEEEEEEEEEEKEEKKMSLKGVIHKKEPELNS